MEVEDLLRLPYFRNISGTFLELNKNAVVTRHFRKGEIICREGDYGSTAFYILEGTVQVYLSTPIAHVKTEGHAAGFLKRLGSQLRGTAGRTGGTRKTTSRTIPIDASVDLPYDHPWPNSVQAICSAK